MEIWKDIYGYENKYQVSNIGNIRNIKTGKYLKVQTYKTGYCYIDLYNNGQPKKYLIHRLVAQAFIPNPYNLPYVNHKDCNPLNNNANNLEWCTQQYNVNYGDCREKQASKTRKCIYGINVKTGDKTQIFNSVNEAADWCKNNGYVKAQQSGISQVLHNKGMSIYGYYWYFI